MGFWTNDRLEPKTCAILIPSRAAGGGAPLRRRLFWSSANAVTIRPAAGGGQVPRQQPSSRAGPLLTGGFFMRPAVGARGSFALSGVIEFAGFNSLSYPARFKSGRPHHLAGTPYRFHKAHDGFLTLSPHHRELAGASFAPAPAGGPGRLCACVLLFFCNRYMRWRGRNEQST